MFRGDTLATTRSGARRKSDTREVGAADEKKYRIWWLVTRRRRSRPGASTTRERRRVQPGRPAEVSRRRETRGHEVGERDLPQEGAGPFGTEQHVTLVDGEQERAHDPRDHDRPPQHRAVPQRAPPALDHRAMARLEEKGRSGIGAVAPVAAGAERRYWAHGPILRSSRPCGGRRQTLESGGRGRRGARDRA